MRARVINAGFALIAFLLAISFVKPAHYRFGELPERITLLTIANGNIRFVIMKAEFHHTNLFSFKPLATLEDHWRDIPTAMIEWTKLNLFPPEAKIVRQRAFGMNVAVPALGLWILWVFRRRVRYLLAEAFWPTHPFRRPWVVGIVRRLIFVVLTSTACASALLWLVSYTAIFSFVRTNYPVWLIRGDWGSVKLAANEGDLIVGDKFRNLNARSRTMHVMALVGMECTVAPQPRNDPNVTGMWGGWSMEDKPLLERMYLKMPIWMIFLATATWPMLVLLRGPLRRAHWAVRGRCRGCGYCIDFLFGARCPECGGELPS